MSAISHELTEQAPIIHMIQLNGITLELPSLSGVLSNNIWNHGLGDYYIYYNVQYDSYITIKNAYAYHLGWHTYYTQGNHVLLLTMSIVVIAYSTEHIARAQ